MWYALPSSHVAQCSLLACPTSPLPLRSSKCTCLNCGATNTPQWRHGPDGPRTLCNACGVRCICVLYLKQQNSAKTLRDSVGCVCWEARKRSGFLAAMHACSMQKASCTQHKAFVMCSPGQPLLRDVMWESWDQICMAAMENKRQGTGRDLSIMFCFIPLTKRDCICHKGCKHQRKWCPIKPPVNTLVFECLFLMFGCCFC